MENTTVDVGNIAPEPRSVPDRLNPLGLLSDVAMIANLARDPETALTLATEKICQHTGWEVGHAFTVGGDDQLESMGVWHLEDELDLCTFGDDTLASDFSHGQGLPGRVALSGTAVLIPDLVSDHDFPRQRAAMESGLQSAFAFPVLVGTDVVAVLEFFTTRASRPDDGLLETMNQIGVQLGRVFERSTAEEIAERSAREVRQILDSAGDAYIEMDIHGLITEWNQTAAAIFGWSRAEAVGHPVTELIIPPEYREDHNRGVERFLTTGALRLHGQHLELSALHRQGHEFPIDITMWAQETKDGWCFYAFVRDISERKREERETHYRSRHDSLTGLPNHRTFVERLGEIATRTGRTTSTAVLAVEIDQLRMITDSMGKDAGDQLLVAVAKRVLGAVRNDDIVARSGSNVLLVLCEYGRNEDFDPMSAARRIHEVLAQPVSLGSDRMYVSASVGVATSKEPPEDRAGSDELIASANAALNRARITGNGSLCLFDDAMLESTTRRINLEADLRQAVARHELSLHYQPLVDARTGTTTGVEALLRWIHPTEGMLSPAEFIPIAEETGLIIPIGRWVIEEAARQAWRWQNEDGRTTPLKLAVNLSARQLAQADIVETIRSVLGRADLDPERVHIAFEVTESLLMDDPNKALDTLRRIRELGADLSIDDFGTGYSSLSYLKRFPVQTVKVDRSFVTDIDTDPADRAIAASVIDLAHALGMDIVAEGVETDSQFLVLQQLGADTIQGYLFSRPRPAEELREILFGPPMTLPTFDAAT